MYVSEIWAGGRLRSAVRLGLGSLLGAVVLVAHVLDQSGTSLTVYYAIGTVLWLALGAFTMSVLVRRGFSRSAWIESIASLLLLVGVAITRFTLLGNLSGDVGVVCFIVFYLAELRGVVRTHPGWYAALAIAGTTVLASLTMAEVEEESPEATISDGGVALLWASSQLFRFGTLVEARPVTGMGQFLGVLVILSGVLFSAVMLSAITAWVVRQGDHGRDDERIRHHVRGALIDAGLLQEDAAPPVPAEGPRLLIDVDDVVGRIPRNWWRSRRLATQDYLATLAEDPRVLAWADPPRRAVVAVIDRSTGVDVDDDTPRAGFTVVVAAQAAHEWIDDQARAGDAAVIGNAEVAGRLAARGVGVIAPARLTSPRHASSLTP